MLAPGKPVTAGGLTASGTSQAAPHVVGAYAALRAQFPAEDHEFPDGPRLTGAGNSVVVTDCARTPRIAFSRLDLWRAMGSCTYRNIRRRSTLTVAVRAAALRTSASHCPLGAPLFWHLG